MIENIIDLDLEPMIGDSGISIIVPTQSHKAGRSQFFENYGLPSILNAAKECVMEIILIDGEELPAPKRTRGVNLAKGNRIFFCDDDIILTEDILLTKMSGHSEDVIYCNYQGIVTDPGAHPNYSANFYQKGRSPFTFENLMNGNFISPMSLISKHAFLKAGGFNETLPSLEDWDLFLTMAKQGATGHWIDEYLFMAFYNEPGLTAETVQGKHAELIRKKHKK